MSPIQIMRSLYSDDLFKAEFFELWMSRLGGSTVAIEGQWQVMLRSVSDELKRLPQPSPQFKWVVPTLKATLLNAAHLGLSFDPNSKQVYIEPEVLDGNRLIFKLGFKYNAYKSIIRRDKNVFSVSADVAFDGDEFQWYGANQCPLIVRTNGQKMDYTHALPIAAYAVIKFTNGFHFASMLESQELLEIQHQDVQRCIMTYGDASQSFYMGTWRKRMFEAAATRRLYRDYFAGDPVIDMDRQALPVSQDDEFIKELEAQLTVKEAYLCAN